MKPLKPDDIISYNQLVAEEKANLQKGMNFGIGDKYPVFPQAPYRDEIDLAAGSVSMKATVHELPRNSTPAWNFACPCFPTNPRTLGSSLYCCR
jgi:hypothetical protein